MHFDLKLCLIIGAMHYALHNGPAMYRSIVIRAVSWSTIIGPHPLTLPWHFGEAEN